MASLAQLKATGADKLLLDAADLLVTRGWSRLIPYDSHTGGLDVLGALCVAAGAKTSDLSERPDLIPFAVPPARQAAVHVAMEVLGGSMNHDPILWQYDRNHCQGELVNALRMAASRLKIAVEQ